jgi:hypothetical protein
VEKADSSPVCPQIRTRKSPGCESARFR